VATVPDSPLAVSLGDPAGIGPEVIAKCWDSRVEFDLPPFVAIGDGRSIAAIWDGPIEVVDDPRQADAAFDYALPLIQISSADPDVPGHPSVSGAHCSLDALELAVGLARSGSASAVVTGPVAKEQLYAIGFQHPGQTEFVAERCGISPSNVVMMLAGPTLRTIPVTTHLAVADVPRHLNSGLIESRGRAALRGLQRNFGIPEPRLAVSGLNPHAGEGGQLGREEIEIIEPAIAALVAEGWRVSGPHPADTMFHGRARQLRRGAVHVPRPGADPHQGAALRGRGEHHARPSDCPHRTRPWHRVRHRRPGLRGRAADGGGDPDGG
jgi:4-hydroxythreonine-4-phosphate dehydrogenase